MTQNVGSDLFPSDNRTEERPLLQAAEVAHLLHLTTRQVYEWTERRIIPDSVVLRVGRRVYYRRVALTEWLAGRDGTKPTL
jgi:predicted DNA-binding transcriptional regulator AlpA